MVAELTTADARQLIDQHNAIQREISDWREWWYELKELGDPRFEEMGVRLGKLYEQLVKHFQLEERSGFFDRMRETHPERRRDVVDLQHQHRHLLASLERIVARLSGPETGYKGWGAAHRDFEEFLDRLHSHEVEEDELGGGLESYTSDEPGSSMVRTTDSL